MSSNNLAQANQAIRLIAREGDPEAIADLLRAAAEKIWPRRSCMSCDFWIAGPPDRRINVCELARVMPPPEVIADGCEQFQFTPF